MRIGLILAEPEAQYSWHADVLHDHYGNYKQVC